MNQIFGQRFTTFEKLRYVGQLLLGLRVINLLLYFIKYRLGQLNKHRKITVQLNSTIGRNIRQKCDVF